MKEIDKLITVRLLRMHTLHTVEATSETESIVHIITTDKSACFYVVVLCVNDMTTWATQCMKALHG